MFSSVFKPNLSVRSFSSQLFVLFSVAKNANECDIYRLETEMTVWNAYFTEHSLSLKILDKIIINFVGSTFTKAFAAV